MPLRLPRFALACAPLVAAALAACSTTADEPEDPVDGPTDTVASVSYKVAPFPLCGPEEQIPLRVQAVAPRGEPLLLVEIKELNASLRPPGACGGLDPCGHFRVLLDGYPTWGSGRVASRTFEVPLSSLPSPLGVHRLEVQFHDDASRPVLGPDGKPIVVTRDVEIVDPGDPGCPAP